jgi:mannan endo-1,4-beta-mannosidase
MHSPHVLSNFKIWLRRGSLIITSAVMIATIAEPVYAYAAADPGASATVTDASDDAVSATEVNRNPTGRFYVIGSRIVAPDGTIFFAHGANIGTTDALDNYGTAIGHSKDAAAWGWNFVRLTLNCTNLHSYSYLATPGNTYAGFMAEIAGLVKEYTSKHIVVDLTCFDDKPGQASNSITTPQYAKFWKSMAQSYKNNTYVWFDPINEPFWEASNTTFNDYYTDFYDEIRNYGAENIIIADLQNDGNDAGWGGTKPIYVHASGPTLIAGKCNLAFGMHNYGGITTDAAYNDYWSKVKAAHIAEVIEETGYTVHNPSPGEVRGVESSLTIAAKYGFGASWWSATTDDGYSLKANDGTGFYYGGDDVGLSTAGQLIWNYGHANHYKGYYPGSYAASNCDSAE